MKKLKDIFYDLNDILVAIVILAVAGLVITVNIDSILKYPSVIAAEMQGQEEQTPTVYAENPPIVNDIGDDAVTDQGTTDAAIDDQDATGAAVDDQNTMGGGGVSGNSGTEEPVNYSVYISYGQTGDQIADILIRIGLFKDRQEFNAAVAAAGAEGKLQAGEFIIPSDATPAEVVEILTN